MFIQSFEGYVFNFNVRLKVSVIANQLRKNKGSKFSTILNLDPNQ